MTENQCNFCPIREKIDSYLEASLDPLLARLLAIKQGIPGYPDELLQLHYKNTADCLLRDGCKPQILCGDVRWLKSV